MAFPPNPYLTPITGPYGTVQVPSSVAPAFGMPTPDPTIPGPLPTFQPGELDASGLGPAPGVTGTEPLPPVGLPSPPAGPAPLTSPTPVSLPPSVQAPQAPQPFVTPDEQAALAASAAPAPQPQAPPPAPGTLESMYANIDQRRDIARRQGELKAATGDAEADALDAANVEEARLTKARDAEREAVNKEIKSARAKQASAMDAFVNHKVDEGRLWKNMSTSRKIFAGIGVALSGLGNALAKKGGAPNPALDIIMGAIKDDVRMQLADRDRLGQIATMRKDAINDLRQQYADGEAAYNGIVVGLTRRTANKVAAIGARAKSPEAKLAAEDFAAKLNAEADNIALANQEREDAAQQRKFQNSLAKSSNALGWANYNRGKFESDRQYDEGKRRFDAELDLRQQNAIADAAAARAKGDEAKAKLLDKEAEKAKKEADEVRNLSIGAGSRKVTTGPDGKPFIAYEPLKQRDGTVFKAPDKLAEPLQKKKASVDNLVRLMDDTVNLMDRHGYEPDFAKSAAWQEMQANWAAMAIDEKTIAELGVLAGPDMGLIAKKLGTGDPTKLISEIPGIRKGRRNTLDKFDSELRAALYDGPKYDIPELTKEGVAESTKNSTVGELNKRAQARESGGLSPRLVQRSISDLGSGKPPSSSSLPTKEAEVAIESIFSVALNGPAESQAQARSVLRVMANDPNPGIRDRVRAKLKAMPSLGIEVPAK